MCKTKDKQMQVIRNSIHYVKVDMNAVHLLFFILKFPRKRTGFQVIGEPGKIG